MNIALFQRNSVFGFSAIALLAAGLILLAVTTTSPVYRLCNNRWLRALGQRSYGFYVYHLLFFAVWQRLAVDLMLGTSPLHAGGYRGRCAWWERWCCRGRRSGGLKRPSCV